MSLSRAGVNLSHVPWPRTNPCAWGGLIWWLFHLQARGPAGQRLCSPAAHLGPHRRASVWLCEAGFGFNYHRQRDVCHHGLFCSRLDPYPCCLSSLYPLLQGENTPLSYSKQLFLCLSCFLLLFLSLLPSPSATSPRSEHPEPFALLHRTLSPRLRR